MEKKCKMGELFIIEGGECSGKTTIAKYLSENIPNLEYLREPGGNKVSEKIRDILINDEMSSWCEAYLFLASRANLIEKTIIPLLKSGKNIIMDRFDLSNVVYQGHVKGCGLIDIVDLNNNLFDRYPEFKICHTWILDINIDTFKRRMGNNDRNNNKFEEYGLKFHEEVLLTYHNIPNIIKDDITLIDANKDDSSARDIIYSEIKQIISLGNVEW